MKNYVDIARKMQSGSISTHPAQYTFKIEQSSDIQAPRDNLSNRLNAQDKLSKFSPLVASNLKNNILDDSYRTKSSPIIHNQNRSRSPILDYINNTQPHVNSNRSQEIFKPPIKKGMFSYPKSTGSPSPVKRGTTKSVSSYVQGDDSSMTLGRNFSLEKFKILKKTDENKSITDETNSLLMNTSLKKSESNVSINFAKYKISNSMIDDGSSSNLFGISTSNREILGQGAEYNLLTGELNPINKSSLNFFKNKRNFEKESRRMAVEMVKTKLRAGLSLSVAMDKVDPIVLEREKQSSSSPMKNSLEIKNNKVEINNNYFGNINVENNSASNSLRSVHPFMYNMEEDSNEKISLLCYLATPRILLMNLGASHRVPFIFQVSPSNICSSLGVEHYILQWNDVKTLSPVGSLDLLKISSVSFGDKVEHCTFVVDTVKDKNNGEKSRYEIVASNPEECKKYVDALNFLSQLVKCKAYSFKNKAR